MFGVKSLYTTPVGSPAGDAGFSIPKFIRTLYKEVGFFDVRRLGLKPWIVNSEDDVLSLCEFIQNPSRRLSVAVVSECFNCTNFMGYLHDGYLFDTSEMARKLGLIAHVVQLTSNGADILKRLIDSNWSVYNGAVRTYYNDVEFSKDDYYNHPLSTANRIMAANVQDKDGKELIAAEAFKIIIDDKIKLI